MNKNALMENDKKRIEEEEKYRAKVRKGLSETPKQKPKGCGKGCLTLIIVLIVLGAIGSIIPSLMIKMTGKSTPPPVIQRDFKASVTFTGTQFVITNLDDLDCQNASMETYTNVICKPEGAFKCSPKGDYVISYDLKEYTLETGKTYEVEATQFTDIHGTRFNPYEKRPKGILIICKGSNILNGINYAVEFN